FEDVVENVNKFNNNILEKEEELLQKNIELQKLNDEIESTLQETMLAVGRIEEIRSKETRLHTKRVSLISVLIAKAYGMSEEEVNLIEFASPLHDIGKVGISDAILNKPAKLTDEEYNTMKSHSILGYEILNHSERKILQTAAIIAYEHHEKYDGTGYPQGLVGEEISIYARIVAIVDVFDALLSKRVYKEKWSLEDVIELLQKESGKHFDPKLVKIIVSNKEECKQIIREFS
nr:HD domain-containing protein [Sulfurimonas sp.]